MYGCIFPYQSTVSCASTFMQVRSILSAISGNMLKLYTTRSEITSSNMTSGRLTRRASHFSLYPFYFLLAFPGRPLLCFFLFPHALANLFLSVPYFQLSLLPSPGNLYSGNVWLSCTVDGPGQTK